AVSSYAHTSRRGEKMGAPRPTRNVELEVRLLGPLEVLKQGNPVALGGPKPRALLAALALETGRVVSIDRLVETLWPGPSPQTARLEELRLVALEDRIKADLELGRHVELVYELEALVQAEPMRERPRGQLMLALYRSGRQADALAAYRAARQTLVDEVGIEPGPKLKQLEAAIL